MCLMLTETKRQLFILCFIRSIIDSNMQLTQEACQGEPNLVIREGNVLADISRPAFRRIDHIPVIYPYLVLLT